MTLPVVEKYAKSFRAHSTIFDSRCVAAQLRDFLHDSLYHPTEGYFNAHKPPIGMGRPLNLPMLPSEDAYREEVRRQYNDLAVLPSHAAQREVCVLLLSGTTS